MSDTHQNHTLKGVMNVALPLIFSSFGWALMVTCDRIMLARFDIQIMNAIAALGSLLFLFEWAIASITVTTEIFAGQYNGLNKKSLAPVATWQMLLFCIFTLLIYIPSGLFLGKYIMPEQYYESAGNFYKFMMCFLVFSPATAAINGFFVGIKKTRIILINTLIANILNILLSYCLIFGVENYIEPQGALGAAIATSTSLVVQFIVIFIAFISNKNHIKYKTRDYSFNKNILTSCLKLGVPTSIGMITEIIGNYTIQLIIISKAPEYLSNNVIALNLFIFVAFLINGMHKAISGLAANIIGEKKLALIPKLFKSALFFHALFTLLIVILTTFFAKNIARLYTDDAEIIANTVLTLPWVAVHFAFDGVGWLIAGIIMAGGDTKFVMYASTLVMWGCRVLPLYLLLELNIKFASIGWTVSALSTIVYAAVFYYRYRSKNWLKMQLS